MENGNGKLKMENGKLRVENGEWKMENGEWKMENQGERRQFVLFYIRIINYARIFTIGCFRTCNNPSVGADGNPPSSLALQQCIPLS